MSEENQLSQAANTLKCDQTTIEHVAWYLIFLVFVIVSVNLCIYVGDGLRRFFAMPNSFVLTNERCLNQATTDDILHNSQTEDECQILDSSDMSSDDELTYDWDNCETLQIAKAFSISDCGTKSDATSSAFLVPEPPTLSGTIDSTTNSSSSETTSVEENYINDDISSLSNVSEIEASNAPRKHEYEKERMQREGNEYDVLYNACLKGQLLIIREILKNCNRTLMPDEHGQTPLYAACFGNHPEIIKLLTDSGYDVNHQDKEGKTPLHTAFENHLPDLASTLISEFGADTSICDLQNWTPLHTAIDRGYLSYAQLLSKKFFHQDVGTKLSWIQLHAACFRENRHDVHVLLNANADANHVSSAGYTPLHIAVTKRNINLINLLLDQGVNVNSMTIDGQTPLHIAADKGDANIIQNLLRRKADPNLKDARGNTSLHLVVQPKQETKPRLLTTRPRIGVIGHMCVYQTFYRACSKQTVQAIINLGADVNAVNNRRQTALWLACCDGQVDVTTVLLNRGADPNIVDENKDSSLHAAMYGHCNIETVQQMIDHGANVNAANKDGTTPLILACSRAQEESVRILLKAKANPNITDGDGDASLHAAIAGDCSHEILQEISYYGVDVNATNKRGRTALLLSCSYGKMDSIKVLLRAGADPTIVDDEGFSCLHAAVDGRCSKETLQELIAHGSHIDATRKDGTNALLRACSTGQSESVRCLLNAGADVNIAKSDGNTCLHEAVYGKCSEGILQNIIEQGMDVECL